jgi:hypothetical protein
VLVKLIQRLGSLRMPVEMEVGLDLVRTAAFARPVLGGLVYTLQKIVIAHDALFNVLI